MNQILTDEEIFKLQYELQYREGGFHPIPFARVIEQAILNKLSEQKPVAYMLRNDVDGVDLSDEAFSWDKDTSTGHTIAVFTGPAPSVPEGYVMTPIEPTEEMIYAVPTDASCAVAYKAMLSAARGE